MLVGVAVDAPDDIANLALAVAQRTLRHVHDGAHPAMAYERAVQELMPEWASRR